MTLIAEKQSWGTRPWTGDSDGKRSQQNKVVYKGSDEKSFILYDDYSYRHCTDLLLLTS